MSSFGLGIVLNFVDNASSGMNNATNTFLNMSNTIRGASTSTSTAIQQVAQGTVLNTLGTALTNFGSNMVGAVGNVLNNVKEVGSDFQLFNVTLQQIYGSAEAAEEQVQKLMDFSVKSPFEVADTKDLLVTLKSQGIEAFDSIKGSISGAEQQTLQWLSDLMSFKPEVPMQRWKLAFQNYIGSGEQKMLRNLLDMGKIDEILGHDISDTVEGRMNDLVEIVEKKNLTGLTNAMFGTMQQNLSNISDFFTMFYKAIGDAGVFDNLARITGAVSKMFATFDNASGKLPILANIVADGFNVLLQPLVAITDKAVEAVSAFLNFAAVNPVVGKLAIVLFGLASAGVVALGWIMRLSGSILMLSGAIKLLGGFSKIFSTIGTGFSILGGKMLTLIPLAFLAYRAWKSNFMGIRDRASETFQKLGLIWDYFKQGYFTDEQFDLAKKLGVDKAVEQLSILKYYWDYFKQGFSEGFTGAFDKILSGIEKFVNKIKELTGIDLNKIIEPIKNFFSNMTAEGLESTYKSIGKVVGAIVAYGLVLRPLLKLLGSFRNSGGLLGPLLGSGKNSNKGGKGGTKQATTFLDELRNLRGTFMNIANLAVQLIGLASILKVVDSVLSSIKMSPGDLAKFILVIGELGLVGQALNYLNSKITNVPLKQTLNSVGNMALMIVSLGLLAGIISALPSVNVGKVTALSIAVGMLALLGTALVQLTKQSFRFKTTTLLTAIRNMAIMISAFGILAGVISACPSVDVGKVLAISVASVILGAAGAGLSYLASMLGGLSGSASQMITGAVAMASMISAFAIIAGVISACPTVDVGKVAMISAASVVLGVAATALVGLAAVCGLMIGAAPLIVSGAVAMGIAIAAFGTIVAVISACPECDVGKIMSLSIAMVAIGVAATALVGLSAVCGLIIGAAPLILAGFVAMAAVIAAFGTIVAVISACPNCDVGKVTSLSVAIVAIGAAATAVVGMSAVCGMLAGIGVIIAAGIVEMTTVFSAFADFAQEISGFSDIDTGKINNYASATTDIAAAATVISGASALTGFIPVDKIKSGIEKISQVIQSMSTLAQQISSYGTIDIGKINSYTQSIQSIGEIGDSLTKIVNKVGKLKTEKITSGIEKIKQCFSAMQGIAVDNLPDIGSNISSFVSGIEPLMSMTTKGNAKNLGNFLDELSQGLKKLGSLKFDSKNIDLSKIANELSNFANTLSTSFSFDSSGISNLISELQSFASITKDISSNADSVKSSISGMSGSLSSFKSDVNGLKGTADSLKSALSKIKDGLSDIETKASTHIELNITDNASAVIKNVQDLLANQAVGTITVSLTDNASAGISNIKSSLDNIPKTVTPVVNLTDKAKSKAVAIKDAIDNITGKTVSISVYDRASSVISSIKAALNNIPSTKTITVNVKQNGTIPRNATGTNYFEGGLTHINEKGGEIVDLPRGTRIIPHDRSLNEALKEGIRMGARSVNKAFDNAKFVGSERSNVGGNTYDNRVVFSQGSIVITTVGASQSEMEKAAEFIMKYIERKQKLRSLAVRS